MNPAKNPLRDAPRSLRFAALLDSESLERWQATAIQSVLRDGIATLVAVVYSDDEQLAERANASKLSRLFRPPERESIGSVREFLEAQGIAAEIRSGPTADLADLRLDFILYLGFGEVDERFGAQAVHGLWLYRFGASNGKPNYPPGVWEIIDGEPVTLGSLCQITGKTAAVVLRYGAFQTISHAPHPNADRLLREAALWPAHVSRLIAQGESSRDRRTIGLSERTSPQIPAILTQVRFVWALLRNKVLRLPNLFYDDSWNVAIVDQPIHAFLAPNDRLEASWHPNHDASVYLADPMGAIVDGTPVVLCEAYDFKSELGSIVRLGSVGARWLPAITPAIPSNVHSSYPYLFEAGGDLFCVPETHQSNEVAMYQVEASGSEYRRVQTLIAAGRYLDPTVFRHDGLWWLFCTDADRGEHSHLLAYHATELGGDWTAHPLNPLKIDVRSARPAGTPFTHMGRLYRPSQDCSRTYGGAVTINEIIRLTPTEFVEEVAAKLQPLSRSRYNSGIHTLSRFGDRTLIDGKRRILTGKGIKEKLRSLVRRAFRR